MSYGGVIKLLQGGDIAGAKQLALSTLKDNPKSSQAYTALAEVYVEEELFEDASISAEEALKQDPDNLKALELSAWSLLQEGSSEIAKGKFLELSQRDPENSFAFGNLGIIASHNGDVDEAFAYYEKALELNPKDMTTLLNLGILYSEQGENDKALEIFERIKRDKAQSAELDEFIKEAEKNSATQAPLYEGSIIELPATPKLFHVEVPEDWNAEIEEDCVKIFDDSKKNILLLTYKNADYSKVIDRENFIEEQREGKNLMRMLLPVSSYNKDGEEVSETAFTEGTAYGCRYNRFAVHSHGGKTLFASFSSLYCSHRQLIELADTIFASLSLRG